MSHQAAITAIEEAVVRRDARFTTLRDSLNRFTEDPEIVDCLSARTLTDAYEIRCRTEERIQNATHAVRFSRVVHLFEPFIGLSVSFTVFTRYPSV